MNWEYLKDKFVWEDADTRIESARYLFFLITFAFGFCFTFFPELFDADQTQLYQSTAVRFSEYGVSLWGAAALWVSSFIVLNHITRWATLGSWSAFLGALLWLYASSMYVIDHFWIGLLANGIPNLAFWVLFYLRATRYHRMHG